MSITSVKNDNVGDSSFINSQKPLPPAIIGYTVNGTDDTALDPAGGQTVLLNGTGFQRGATITLNGSAIAVVSFVSTNQLSFTSPALSAGTYTIYVVNADLGTAIYIPGLIYSNLPTWTTSAGTLGSYYETTSISTSVVATGDAPITYSLFSGSLPSGSTLYANGVITGTAPVDSGSTTYSFTVRATDAQLQDSNRSFSLTINTDVVTWTNPTNGATINLTGAAYSNVLTATDAAGYSIASFTANALPTGLTLSGNTISGTPTVAGNTTTLLTATASTTGRSATNTVTWVVSLGDVYWKYVTSLLSTSTPTTTPFNTDNSINNAVLTVNGDTKPNNFNPYNPTGYYGVNFTAKTDYISIPATTALTTFTGDFTFEAWIYPSDTSITYWKIWDSRQSGATAQAMVIGLDPLASPVTGQGRLSYFNGSSSYGTGIVYYNRWTHIAFVRSGSTMTFYIDGVAGGTATISGTQTGSATTNPVYIGTKDNGLASYGSTGYISNFRIVNGTAVYTGNFTPSTAPLTAITNTVLLACQSNRYRDNSTNNYTLTASSTTQISGFIPYTPNSSYSTYGSTYMDGTGDYLSNSTSNTALAFGSGDFTIEFWMYCATSATVAVIYDNRINTTNNTGGFNIYHQSGTIYAYGGATTNVLLVSGTITYNTWNHIAVVRNGTSTGNVKLYINGILVSTYGSADTSSYVQGYLNIGCYLLGGTASNFYTGYITDFRMVKGTAVYTTAFTPPTAPLTAVANTQLLTCQGDQPVNNNVFIDNSTNNFLITRNGNTTQGTFSPYGANFSNYFDGNGDYLVSPVAVFGLNTIFTVEVWVYPTALTSGAIVFASTATGEFSLGYNGTTRFGVSARAVSWLIDSTTLPTLNQWNHIAVCRDGLSTNQTRLYMNGTLAATATVSNAFTVSSTWQVGYDGGGGGAYWPGYISNLRVVKGTALYNANFTPPTAPLQPIAGTTFLTCQSPSFVDNSPNNYALTRNGDVNVQKFSPFAGTTLPTPYYSASFNGSSDYLTTPSFSLTLATWTMELWLYTTSTTQYQTFVHRGNGSAWSVTSIFDLYMSGTTTGTLVLLNGTGGVQLNGSTQINNGAWHHVAVTYDGTNYRLFVDGKLDAYQSGSAMSTASYLFYIGYDPRNVRYTSGYISNFRFVDGSVVYSTSSTTLGATIFTPPTVPLTAIANTSLLTCQSSTFVDNSTNNFTITATGDSKPTAFNPFTVTYSTGQSYTPSVYGGSMYVDGTGDYLSSTIPSFGTGDFTIEGWTYNTGSVVNNGVFHLATSGFPSAITGLALAYFTTSGGWNLYYANGSQSNAGTNPVPFTWYHFAVVRSGTALKVYINGILTISVTDSTNYTLTSMNIGGYYSTSYLMTGYISDFRVVKGQALYTSNFVPQNSPLQAVKNTVLLVNGTSAGIYDSSEMANYETVADAKINNFGPYNGSYYSNYFSASGSDFMTFTNNTVTAFSGIFTIEFWVYYTSISASHQLTGVNTSGALTLYYDTLNNNRLSPNVNGTGNIFVSTFTPVVGQWYHIAMTRDASNLLTMWVNGSSVGSATKTGSFTTGAYQFNPPGTNAGVYLSNYRILTGTALYTTAFTVPTQPLTAITNTSLLTCQSNKFVDNSASPNTLSVNGLSKIQTQNPFQANIGESMYFDGTGDYLTTPSVSFQNFAFNTGDFTMEAWIYPTVFSGDKVIISSFQTWSTSVNFFFGTRAGTPNVLIFRAGDSLPISLIGNTALNVNQWAHVAVSRSSGTTRIFVNGVVQTATHTGTVNISATVRPVMIGSDDAGAPAELFVGYISDLRVTKGIARYTTAFTPPTSPLSTK